MGPFSWPTAQLPRVSCYLPLGSLSARQPGRVLDIYHAGYALDVVDSPRYFLAVLGDSRERHVALVDINVEITCRDRAVFDECRFRPRCDRGVIQRLAGRLF